MSKTLSQALELVKSSNTDHAKVLRFLNLTSKIVQKIKEVPGDERFRRIVVNRDLYQQNIAVVKNSTDVFAAIGYKFLEQSQTWLLDEPKEGALTQLAAHIDELQKFILSYQSTATTTPTTTATSEEEKKKKEQVEAEVAAKKKKEEEDAKVTKEKEEAEKVKAKVSNTDMKVSKEEEEKAAAEKKKERG
eukprot:TRINITY_DN6141_c0_g1_i1.p1 TRINITY_DN6141_c0_g1~~TRINITY_DN6141_c0_g1_i1.p1  ORF type:complete len:208 (-),score=73.77 TRINITY_DN6141_c0_g1_i1:34-603(-)